MFGDGISLIDLTLLLKAIRDKDLELQCKVLNDPWEQVNKVQIKAMIQAVVHGDVKGPGDIRLRLFEKNSDSVSPKPAA